MPAIALLVADWGYPSAVADVAERLARLRDSAGDFVQVAHAPGGAVAGWIHAAAHQTLASAPVCEILGLMVGREYRNQGLGRALVDTVSAWAAARGLERFVVRSNVVRPDAHAFYTSLGFMRTKTQHVYARNVAWQAAEKEPI